MSGFIALLRFMMICGLASVGYMASAVALLESWRLVSSDEPGNVEKIIANVLAITMGAALAFFGLRRYGGTARAGLRGSTIVPLMRWFAVVSGALALHEVTLFAFLHWAPWSWVLCETAALGCAGAAAFLASRRWVFA